MADRRIVVIDSGIDPGHPALRDRVTVVAAPSPVEPADRDDLGHGTAVAATIAQFLAADERLELVSLRVFDREPVCAFELVVAALEQAVGLAPLLINLSLGTTSLRHRQALERCVAAAHAVGCRIVTPASYVGLPCDPGNVRGVEAVAADANVLPTLPELRRHGDRMLWFASPLPPKGRDGRRHLLARGDSLAVAAVTGFLWQRSRQ